MVDRGATSFDGQTASGPHSCHDRDNEWKGDMTAFNVARFKVKPGNEQQFGVMSL
jgi:hypothetical protein